MINRPNDSFALGQRKVVSELLGDAFSQDPLMTYVFPDPITRIKLLRKLFLPTVRCSHRYGGVEVTSGGEGALTWLSGEYFPLRLPELVWSGMILTPLDIGLAAFKRLQGHETYCEHEIKKLSPDGFAYIWSLGVSPKSTGKGFGGHLMQTALTAMRSRGHSACLLKTESQRNVSLNEHFGFKKIHANIVPESGLRYWVLRKEL